MRALIYGGGAVGLGLASCLLKSQVSVDIIAREGTVSALQRNGLVRTGIFGDFHAGASAFGSYSLLTALPPGTYAYILVCTKSFDSLNAAKDLSEHKSLLADRTKIVLFQNGWGNADAFLGFFEKERIYNARVITGFQRLKPNEVDVTVHADAIHIGSLFGAHGAAVNDLAGTIGKGGIPCQVTKDIGKDIWAKMLYNCALNPLGAILDVPYGTLAAHEFTRAVMNGIVEETFDVMSRAGYETHWQCAEDFLDVFYGQLVPDTAEHKSSTLQDIIAGKPTEIDALNGAVIQLAGKFSLSVPYNCVVHNLVKFIEAKNR
ncbi:MAG: 2-dehydropantoate 2-reductase [Phycisphaerales bacterium]|nr:MAG: 2-dehydropantoate 2-reductase [Phycisphaerales bacterium]